MTNEELDKRIEFIIQQQARLVTNQEKADERMTRLENIVGRLATASLERFENLEDKVTALDESQVRLTDAQTRTEENLNNLIAVADRYFSEGRNGRA
jgi:ElaB/YqjD/DUF883 family membrane-anchored ribosome-binding protein